MKIRKGFISNSSSTSFVIDYYVEKKDRTSLKEVKETVDRIIKAYNIIYKTKLQKKRTFTIGKITDEIIKARIDFEREYAYDDKGEWGPQPISKDRKKAIENQKGKIIINSVEDNSIPYLMQEMIENVLNADKWHWG